MQSWHSSNNDNTGIKTMGIGTLRSGSLMARRVRAMAGLTFMGLASSAAMAAVIDSGPVSLNVTPNLDGLYLNMVTGASANATIAGWDFNPYQTGGFLVFFTSAGAGNNNQVVGTGTGLTALLPGAVVGPASTFASVGPVSTLGTSFRTTGTSYVGFRFTNETGSTLHYGYAIMTTTAATGFPAVVTRFVWDNTPNTPVTIVGASTAPVFAFTPATGTAVGFTGGAAVGSTGAGSIAVALGAPAGSGSGAPSTTTLTCTAPTAPFAGFAQTITAVGAGAISGASLSGTCTLGAAAVTQALTCNENRGGSANARTWTLSCPAGTAIPLTSTPISGSTVATPPQAVGGAATTSTLQFQNPGAAAATVTCTAPTATQFTVAPLIINVPAAGNASTTVTYSNPTAGLFTGVLNCTAGAQTFTFSLAGSTAVFSTSVPVPTLSNIGLWLAILGVFGLGLLVAGGRRH